MGTGGGNENRVVRTTLPQFPSPPELPKTPFPGRRFEIEGLEIRPLSGPAIDIPKTEDEDFLRRFDGWHALTNGSLPEYIVYEFLVFKKKQIPGVDFIFQHPLLGGRTLFGGFVLDFFLTLRQAGWRVLGTRFHLLQAQDRARDLIARSMIEQRGIQVIDLWDDDLLERAEYVLNLAWGGQEVVDRRPGN